MVSAVALEVPQVVQDIPGGGDACGRPGRQKNRDPERGNGESADAHEHRFPPPTVPAKEMAVLSPRTILRRGCTGLGGGEKRIIPCTGGRPRFPAAAILQ